MKLWIVYVNPGFKKPPDSNFLSQSCCLVQAMITLQFYNTDRFKAVYLPEVAIPLTRPK